MLWTVTIIEYSGRGSTFFISRKKRRGLRSGTRAGRLFTGLIENYIRREMQRGGFREVRTPQLLSRSLWERSGHWEKFGANMFEFADDERRFALKPMNCPGHVQLFRQQVRSYRDLPVTDEANESLSRRIVAAHNKGIPMFVTVGAKEVSAGTVTIRERGGVG